MTINDKINWINDVVFRGRVNYRRFGNRLYQIIDNPEKGKPFILVLEEDYTLIETMSIPKAYSFFQGEIKK